MSVLVGVEQYPTMSDAAKALVLSHFRRNLEHALREEKKGDHTLKGALKYYRNGVFIDENVLWILKSLVPRDALILKRTPRVKQNAEQKRRQEFTQAVLWAMSQSDAEKLLEDIGLRVSVFNDLTNGWKASFVDAPK